MFETDQYDVGYHPREALAPESAYKYAEDIERMSFLFWSEHCTECAAPACFQSCDLYQPRRDGRCRRFRYGIYKNRRFPSVRGYGAEIEFKKWAKLVARGNTSMEPTYRLLLEEQFVPLARHMISAVGTLVRSITKDERWMWPDQKLVDRVSQALHKRNANRDQPDAFLIEVYNPSPSPVRMQLFMDYPPESKKQLGVTAALKHHFRTTLTFENGYSRHNLDQKLFRSLIETSLPFNLSLVLEADACAKLVFLTTDFVKYRNSQSAPKNAPGVKCVVWDLDNTLWDGTLAENDDVRLRPGIPELLNLLDQRGILLSIASKNNHDSAWRRIEEFGLADYFLLPQINWAPKSENIRKIAKRLNVGLDSLAFVDDNPFELNEVAAAVPEVYCLNAAHTEELRRDSRFEGSRTQDSQNRRQHYKDAIVREEKQADFGDDYLRFLRYAETRLQIDDFRNEDFDRVAELAQRTNQLNFSGRKYDRHQLRELLAKPDIQKYVLSCSDKFGSYGLIGFGLARDSGDEMQILDLMLSCRVQGKCIEQAFFSHLQALHTGLGAKRIFVNFKETDRNQPARQALEAANFTRSESTEGFARNAELIPVPGAIPVTVTCSIERDRHTAKLELYEIKNAQ